MKIPHGDVTSVQITYTDGCVLSLSGAAAQYWGRLGATDYNAWVRDILGNTITWGWIPGVSHNYNPPDVAPPAPISITGLVPPPTPPIIVNPRGTSLPLLF